MTTRLVTLDAGQSSSRLDEWRTVYNSCFTVVPWNEPAKDPEEYATQMKSRLVRIGFTAVEARARSGQQVAGVAYGWPTPVVALDEPFYWAMRRELPSAVTERLLGDDGFEVAELMVAPVFRGRGLSRLLLSALCPDRTTCWLCTLPASPAARMYDHLGWEQVGQFTASSNTPSRRWAIYALP